MHSSSPNIISFLPYSNIFTKMTSFQSQFFASNVEGASDLKLDLAFYTFKHAFVTWFSCLYDVRLCLQNAKFWNHGSSRTNWLSFRIRVRVYVFNFFNFSNFIEYKTTHFHLILQKLENNVNWCKNKSGTLENSNFSTSKIQWAFSMRESQFGD